LTQVPIALGAYKRSASPAAVLLNAYVEKVPTQQSSPAAIRARGGWTTYKTVGIGPIRAIFTKAGLFSDSAIVLSGSTAYLLDDTGAATAQSGAFTANDIVDIDAGQDADLDPICRFATGSRLYKLTLGGVTQEDFPSAGGPGATSVCEHRGFWFATETGTDQAFYQVQGDTTWLPLSFASAEYSPDPLKGIRSRGDQFVLLGAETTEVWTLTGQADPAIAPYGGLNFDFGCRSIRSAVNCAGSLIWVDHRCVVRLFQGGAAEPISDSGISEQIRQVGADDLVGSWYPMDGHIFYRLKVGSVATLVFDLTEKRWMNDASYGLDYSRQHLTTAIADTVLAADSISAQVYRLNPDALTDAGGDFHVRFSAFVEALEGPVACVNVELSCEVGNSPRTGQGSSPIIQMRYSDDEGKTWTAWMERSLGATGASKTRVRWSGLTDIESPQGRIFQFQCSDPTMRRFSALMMNVP
jgi:hypothetical protein